MTTTFTVLHKPEKSITPQEVNHLQPAVNSTQISQVSNKTGIVSITWRRGVLWQPLLQWKGNRCYIFWACICSRRYAACNAYEP